MRTLEDLVSTLRPKGAQRVEQLDQPPLHSTARLPRALQIARVDFDGKLVRMSWTARKLMSV